MLKW